ncbi:MAG: DNA-binding protein [Ignavibacteriaceae bacterium]|nr:DNA-binding protein [Ignavibacteriaceae bacterium]
MEYIGNLSILKFPKTGFLCSRKVPSGIILKTYDWAIEQRDNGVCVVSGFHSKIEKDVFRYLLKGGQPIMMVLARGMKKRWEKEILEALELNRLLIISPFKKTVTRVDAANAERANRLIIEFSDSVFIPYHSPNGSISKVISRVPAEKTILSL